MRAATAREPSKLMETDMRVSVLKNEKKRGLKMLARHLLELFRTDIERRQLKKRLNTFFLRERMHDDDGRNIRLSAVVFKSDLVQGSAASFGVHIDTRSVTNFFRKFGDNLGANDARIGSRVTQAAARRIAKAFSEKFSGISELERESIAQAWFFPIWTEICTLLPLRHLARNMAGTLKNEVIFIHIDQKCLEYLNHWERNELELIYLAYQLRKRSVNAIIVLRGIGEEEASKENTNLSISFRQNSKYFIPYTSRDLERIETSKAWFVPSGIRYYHQTLEIIGSANILFANYSYMVGPFDAGILRDSAHLQTTRTLEFRKSETLTNDKYCSFYLSSVIGDNIVDLCFELYKDMTISALINAAELVRSCQIEMLHVCDHSFFESALLAHATRNNGGRVTAWPHSSNASHASTYREGDLCLIRCATNGAARVWKKTLPKANIEINSHLTLSGLEKTSAFDANEPINIVVIGGAYALNRTPLVEYDLHVRCYIELFDKLSNIYPKQNVVFRPKSGWETQEWLEGILGDSRTYEICSENPSLVCMPNMIFVCVSLASSAILEGAARGIPSMIVRNGEVEDYVTVDPAYVPIGSASEIVEQIAKCRNAEVFTALVEKQRRWFESETRF